MIDWILFCAALACCIGSLSWFFLWCIGEPNEEGAYNGRVFSFYGVWLSRSYNRWEKKHPNKLNPTKPIGMCGICTSTWIGFACCVAAWLLIGLSPWTWLLIISAGVYLYTYINQ